VFFNSDFDEDDLDDLLYDEDTKPKTKTKNETQKVANTTTENVLAQKSESPSKLLSLGKSKQV